MCINLVRVRYRPEGTQEGSRMMYTVDNTTATTATLANLQCNTKYIVLVYASGRQGGITSVSRMAFLPARGMSLASGRSRSLSDFPFMSCTCAFNLTPLGVTFSPPHNDVVMNVYMYVCMDVGYVCTYIHTVFMEQPK